MAIAALVGVVWQWRTAFMFMIAIAPVWCGNDVYFTIYGVLSGASPCGEPGGFGMPRFNLDN